MQHNLYLPQVELTMDSVLVTAVLVKEGDFVEAEQPVIEIETQKATVEVPAGLKGYIRKIFVQPNEQIGERALLCVLTETPEEQYSIEKELSAANRMPSDGRSSRTNHAAAPSGGEMSDGRVRAVPAARKLAQDHGIDLTHLRGTGPGGRIVVADVEAAIRLRENK